MVHNVSTWYPGLESNQHLLLRTELFYPLNYRGATPLYRSWSCWASGCISRATSHSRRVRLPRTSEQFPFSLLQRLPRHEEGLEYLF